MGAVNEVIKNNFSVGEIIIYCIFSDSHRLVNIRRKVDIISKSRITIMSVLHGHVFKQIQTGLLRHPVIFFAHYPKNSIKNSRTGLKVQKVGSSCPQIHSCFYR